MIEDEKKEQKNLMLALVLIIALLLGMQWWQKPKTQMVAVPLDGPAESAETVAAEAVPAVDMTARKSIEAAQEIITIPVENSVVAGSLNAGGTDLNNLSLTTYRETTQEDSPFVVLLSRNWQTGLNWEGGSLPDTRQTPQVVGEKLTPETPVIMRWENETARIERTITLDNAYMMTFTDKLTNKSGRAIEARLIGRVERTVDSVNTTQSSVHEGFLSLVDNTRVEERWSAIEPGDSKAMATKGGWIGMTDKYWQAIFVPEQSATTQMTFNTTETNYTATFQNTAEIAAGATKTQTTKLFAGAKELSLINDYEEQGIPRFDLTIDFGWYYFLTKPFLYFLGFLYSLVGNMGVAILVFATLLRILMLPIATKTYENMAKMKKLQPKIKALQERFKDNKQQLQIEMMNLYKRDKVNPAGGCLPMLIQIPVFFALYKVLSVSILMRQAPFFGWITDLSQPDPSSVFTAFGLLAWPIPSFLNIGVWPIIMGLTMVIQQKMNPSPTTSEDQKVIMNLMPIIFTFMMGNFASGLVIYWTWSNILSIMQQRYIMKKVGA